MTTAYLLSRALILVEQRKSWLLAAWRASYSGRHWSIKKYWKMLNWAALLGPLSFSFDDSLMRPPCISWLNGSVKGFSTQVISLQVLKGKKKTMEQATACNWVVFYGTLYVLITHYYLDIFFVYHIDQFHKKLDWSNASKSSVSELSTFQELWRRGWWCRRGSSRGQRAFGWTAPGVGSQELQNESRGRIRSVQCIYYIYMYMYMYICTCRNWETNSFFRFDLIKHCLRASQISGRRTDLKVQLGYWGSKAWWGKIFQFDLTRSVCPTYLQKKPTILRRSNTSTVPSTRSKGPPKQAVGPWSPHEFLFSGFCTFLNKRRSSNKDNRVKSI